MEVYRGDIFFITGNSARIGSEQKQDRPAVVVSNDKANEHSPVIEVVFLTSAEKTKFLPTHVDVMCQIPSVALCEQVHSISKTRLGQYVRTCTSEEMKRIDNALMVSLGLEGFGETRDAFDFAKIEDENRELKTYLKESKEANQCLQKDFNELMDKYEALMKQPIFQPDPEEVVKLKAQVEMLERQNERLLDRLIG